jgi:hypothetical protein
MTEGTPNKSFATELRAYELSWTPGTAEYAKRKDYPGATLREHTCPKYNCVAYDGTISHDTYFICEECAALAPCSVASFRNAPYKIKPPLKKRRMASAVCLATFFCRRRAEKLTAHLGGE